MKRVPESLTEIEAYMKERVGLGTSFDFGIRKIKVLDREVHFYYINGLIDTLFVISSLEELVNLNDFHDEEVDDYFALIKNRINHQSVEEVKYLDEAVDQILSGLIAIFVEGETKAFVVDTRSYPGRTP